MRQLRQLSDKENAYYSKTFYLLESLSSVKSIVLLTDLNADELIAEVFHDFFEMIK